MSMMKPLGGLHRLPCSNQPYIDEDRGIKSTTSGRIAESRWIQSLNNLPQYLCVSALNAYTLITYTTASTSKFSIDINLFCLEIQTGGFTGIIGVG